MPFPVSRAERLPDDVSPAFARSAVFWLRAYPRRWRVARGEEVLGVLVDLAAPGARRIGPRSAFDLVRGGWATRLRDRPPLGAWLLYRSFDRRIPGHEAWLRDDIDGALGPARRYLFAMWPIIVMLLLIDPRNYWAVAIVMVCMLPLTWRYHRRLARERHLVPLPGEPFILGGYRRVPAPRRRVRAVTGLPWLVGCAAVLGSAGVASVLIAPDGIWGRPMPAGDGHSVGFESGIGPIVNRWPAVAVALGALFLGLAAVPVVRRRLRRCEPVDQPNRELTRTTARGAMLMLLGTGSAVALPMLEIVGAIPLVFGLLIAVAAFLVLPGAVVAWYWLDRGMRADVALVDVWDVATRKRTFVDPPGTRLEVVDASEVGMVLPWPWSNQGPTSVPG